MSAPEPGLDGWHVCGLDGKLFYSRNPVITVSASRSVNIEKAGRHHWTEAMHERHAQVRLSTGLQDLEKLPLILHLHLDLPRHSSCSLAVPIMFTCLGAPAVRLSNTPAP